MYKVTKHHFYRKTGSRFDETFPHKCAKDRQICSCTKAVADRPEGEPDCTTVQMEYLNDDWGILERTYQIKFDLNIGYLNLFWDDGKHSCGPHAYFWLNHMSAHGGYIENSISVSIGYEHFEMKDPIPKTIQYANLFFGDQIDTSKFMNGHCTSRIIQNYDIKSNDVWIHGSDCGFEDIVILPDNEETSRWRDFHRALKHIALATKSFESNPVEEIHKILSDRILIHYKIVDVINWAVFCIENASKMTLFPTSKKMHNALRQKVMESFV